MRAWLAAMLLAFFSLTLPAKEDAPLAQDEAV
jgi:hypothetical protein